MSMWLRKQRQGAIRHLRLSDYEANRMQVRILPCLPIFKEPQYNNNMKKEQIAYADAIDFLRHQPTNYPIRVDKSVAKEFLLRNEGVSCNGYIFFFGIRDLGLNVCEIWKADLAQRENKLIKKK